MACATAAGQGHGAARQRAPYPAAAAGFWPAEVEEEMEVGERQWRGSGISALGSRVPATVVSALQREALGLSG